MEELYQNKSKYVGPIMPNNKGLRFALKTAKEWGVLSSKFIWKNYSPVIIVSYCPKPNNNILVVSTGHSEVDLCKTFHKKPVVFDFYNSQKRDAEIVNQMLCDYTFQSTCDSWVLLSSPE